MQVKKFEARTMKEALAMVKSEMGPEAIILSAKDNSKKFGLLGENSFEITAAISDTSLVKKRFAQTKLPEKKKVQFEAIPAKQQKVFIEKVMDKFQDEQKDKNRPPITKTRYVEIAEEEGMTVKTTSPEKFRQIAREAVSTMPRPSMREIYQSIQTAEEFSQGQNEIVSKPPTKSSKISINNQDADFDHIQSLKEEISSLKKIISDFQKTPQGFITPHPGADYGLPFELSFMFEKLVSSGISTEHAAEILSQAKEQLPALNLKKKAHVDAWTAKYILDNTRVSGELNKSQFHVFVGPPGHGKTSMLVKMASHLIVKAQKRVAIVSADTFKVGAAEQLKIYAQILNVPFATIRSHQEWYRLIPALKTVDYVLVDFPGLSLNEVDEITKIKQLLPPQEVSVATHLVMSSTLKERDAFEMVRRYKIANCTDFMFTRLDESYHHGLIFSLSHKLNLPIHSFGTGAQIPENFEVANKERVLDLIFKISNTNFTEKEPKWETSA